MGKKLVSSLRPTMAPGDQKMHLKFRPNLRLIDLPKGEKLEQLKAIFELIRGENLWHCLKLPKMGKPKVIEIVPQEK